MRIELTSIDDLKNFVYEHSQQAATSDWVDVTQDMINRFAEVTHDHQWIHLDVARAQAESPFKHPTTGARTTVAHGFLTISLLSHLMHQAVGMPPVKAGVNYGCDKLRFVSPVPAGSRVRGVVKLLKLEEVPGMLQLHWDVTIECEGSEKPAAVAVWITRVVP
jgi:acyl dehydratase